MKEENNVLHSELALMDSIFSICLIAQQRPCKVVQEANTLCGEA